MPVLIELYLNLSPSCVPFWNLLPPVCVYRGQGRVGWGRGMRKGVG